MSEEAQDQPPPNPNSPFSQLTIMLASSALQQLGHIPGPDGKQPPSNLDGAQAMIDMIEMLEQKTKGNLNDDETRVLKDALTMLRFQFVEAKNKQSGSASRPASSEVRTPQTETPPADEESPAPEFKSTEPKEDKTRFRKSYG